MTQHILGVEIVDAGCKTLRITPHLGDLEWAEGTFPTPLGIVYIKHVKGADGKIVSTVKAPDGIKVI
jgi:alpha-L-rhamnosidase